MTDERRFRIHLACVLIASLACMLLLSSFARAQSSSEISRPLPTLPPRPTVQQPEVQEVAKSEVCTAIELRTRFSQDWPWDEVHWQLPWTVVQWQDEWGTWHTVEGWQGQLDGIVIDEDGTVVGNKVWWVYEGDGGKGPFRWVVALGEGGPQLVVSDLFHLPTGELRIVWVDLSLTQ